MQTWAEESFCHLTTPGRRTGRAHTIEIWFGLREGRLYMLAGGGKRADWVRNLMADPVVLVRVGDETVEGRASVVEDPEEDRVARELLAAKYQGWRAGQQLSHWAQTALPVVVELPPPAD